MKNFIGTVTDHKTGRQFQISTQARDVHHAKQILESQHAPNRVNFIRETK